MALSFDAVTAAQLALSADVSMSSPPPRTTETVAAIARVHLAGEALRTFKVGNGRRQEVDSRRVVATQLKTGRVTTLAIDVALWTLRHLSHHGR